MLTAAELEKIEAIANQFAHVLPLDVPATGSQWIRLIEDAAATSTQEVIELVKKGMRVIDFQDDYIVFQSKKTRDGTTTSISPAFRGVLSACNFFTEENHYARIVPTAKCSPQEMAEAEATMLKVFQRECEVQGSVQGRARKFLKQSPIQPETFSEAQINDIEAMEWLVTDMITRYGYGSIVGYQPPKPAKTSQSYPSLTLEEWQYPTISTVMNRVSNYIKDMVERGMDFNDPKNKLFLGRPSPITHPTSSLQSFESFVHPQIIGWQIPTPLVKHVAEQIQKEAEDSKHVERERA